MMDKKYIALSFWQFIDTPSQQNIYPGKIRHSPQKPFISQNKQK